MQSRGTQDRKRADGVTFQDDELSQQAARENAIDEALRTHGQTGVNQSIVFETLEQTLIDKF